MADHDDAVARRLGINLDENLGEDESSVQAENAVIGGLMKSLDAEHIVELFREFERRAPAGNHRKFCVRLGLDGAARFLAVLVSGLSLKRTGITDDWAVMAGLMVAHYTCMSRDGIRVRTIDLLRRAAQDFEKMRGRRFLTGIPEADAHLYSKEAPP